MQQYKWMTIVLLGLFLLIMELSFSNTEQQTQVNFSNQQIALYQRQLLSITPQFNNKELNITAIKHKISQLTQIKSYANDCSQSKQKQIAKLTKLSIDLNTSSQKVQKNIQLTQEFKNDKEILLTDKNNCEILAYEAEKTLYIANNILLTTDSNPRFKNFFELLNGSNLFQAGEIRVKNQSEILGVWRKDTLGDLLEISLISLVIGLVSSKLIYNYAKQCLQPMQASIYRYFSFIFTPLLIIFNIWMYMFDYTQDLKAPPPIVNIMYFLVMFLLLKFITDIYLKHIYYQTINNPAWIKKTNRYINYLFVTMFFNICYSFVVHDMLVQTNTAIFLTKCANLTSFLFWIEWLLLLHTLKDKTFIYHKKFENVANTASFAISTIYLIRIIASLFEIDPEVDNLISNTTLKICTIGLLFFLTAMLNKLLHKIENYLMHHPSLQKWLTYNRARRREIWEFYLIRIGVIGLFTIYSMYYILDILGLPDSFIANYNDFFFNGFKFGDVEVAPCTILYSFLTFGLFSLVGKSTAFHIASHASLEHEKDKKNTLEKTFRYLFYVLALIFTLYIWGIKIQEIYYMLGAIGLGVGFGLQSLVMDAISGILILIIKPIHIGDYITILAKDKKITVSGYVQEIDFLSTQIITHHSNITRVPNGVLFREFIANYSNFQNDTHSYLALTLEDINDFSACKETMLKIAKKKPNIINNIYSKPLVSFECLEDEQGQDLSVLTLSFTVKNTDEKKFIINNLEKEIIKKLKLQGIKVRTKKNIEPS